MRKLFVVTALVATFISTSAHAAWAKDTTDGAWTETQILTRAIPNINTPKDWIPLTGARAFDVEVCAEAGQTLAGAGSLTAYKKGTVAPLRNKSLDLPITVAATDCQGAACRCQLFPTLKVSVGIGAFMFAATGVTVSAGTTVTVRIITTSQTAWIPIPPRSAYALNFWDALPREQSHELISEAA